MPDRQGGVGVELTTEQHKRIVYLQVAMDQAEEAYRDLREAYVSLKILAGVCAQSYCYRVPEDNRFCKIHQGE